MIHRTRRGGVQRDPHSTSRLVAKRAKLDAGKASTRTLYEAQRLDRVLDARLAARAAKAASR